MVTAFLQIKNGKQFFQIFSVRLLIVKQHREHNILLHGKLRHQIERLKYKSDIPAAENGKFAVIHGKNFLAANRDFAGVRRVKRADHIEQRTFAGAGFSNNGHILALWNGKADLFQGMYGCFAASVSFTDIVDFQ